MPEAGRDVELGAATGRQGEIFADATVNGATEGARLDGVTITASQAVSGTIELSGNQDAEIWLHGASGTANYSIQHMLLDGQLVGTAVTGTVPIAGAALAAALLLNARGKRRAKVTITAGGGGCVLDRAEYNAL